MMSAARGLLGQRTLGAAAPWSTESRAVSEETASEQLTGAFRGSWAWEAGA